MEKCMVALYEKPEDEGLTRKEVVELYDMLKDHEALPVMIENPAGGSVATGFITFDAAEKLDYDISGLKEAFGRVLGNMTLENDSGIYHWNGLSVYLSRPGNKEICKQDFITAATTGKCETYDKKVATFIADILFDSRNDNDSIRSFFKAGYCYYFANMLKSAFRRGTTCVAYPNGHIVWVDMDGRAYDIEGPYLPEENDCERFIPTERLGWLLDDFTHTNTCQAPKPFRDWAYSLGMTDSYAAISIYKDMKDPGAGAITDLVYSYWQRHKESLTVQFQKEGTL